MGNTISDSKYLKSVYGEQRANVVETTLSFLSEIKICLLLNRDFFSRVSSIISGIVHLSNGYYLKRGAKDTSLELYDSSKSPLDFCVKLYSVGNRSCIQASHRSEHLTTARVNIEKQHPNSIEIWEYVDDTPDHQEYLSARITEEEIPITYDLLINSEFLDSLANIYGKRTKKEKPRVKERKSKS